MQNYISSWFITTIGKKACCATKAEPNGNEAEAKQRALDVYKKAKDLYDSDDNGSLSTL